MAKFYTGRDGRLLLGGNTLVKVTNWQLSAELETLETTTLGDSQRTYVPGLQSFSGSANLMYYVDDDNTNDASTLLRKVIKTSAVTTADTVSLTLRLTDGGTNNDVTLTAYITSASIGSSVGEVVTAQISFQGTGALATASI
jgi:hypothetical protein